MNPLNVAWLVCLLFASGGMAGASEGAPPYPDPDRTRGIQVSGTIRGEFDVTMLPQPSDAALGEGIGRMGLDKRYRGSLAATGKGQMLAFRTAVEGSAAYVALEEVDGTLGGKAGGFVLQHAGTMDRGAATLVLTVVPDSGTGELVGLTGSMQIEIADGKHFYTFDYVLPPR